MARHGTMFETACTTNPVCAPARAAMQTGMYPTNTGVYRNNVPLPTDAPTLGRLFGTAGYQTGYIGKWHLGTQDPVPVAEQGGYDFWLGSNLLEFTLGRVPDRRLRPRRRTRPPARLPAGRVDRCGDQVRRQGFDG